MKIKSRDSLSEDPGILSQKIPGFCSLPPYPGILFSLSLSRKSVLSFIPEICPSLSRKSVFSLPPYPGNLSLLIQEICVLSHSLV